MGTRAERQKLAVRIFSISLREEDYALLEKKALQEDRPMSQMARVLLKNALKKANK